MSLWQFQDLRLKMKCPACFNSLTSLQVGALKVDVCSGGCGGIWFDAFELQRADEEHEVVAGPLLNIRRQSHVHVDPARKRECPRCGDQKLLRHRLNPRSKVEVDECPACGGCWLDHGELATVHAENSALKRTANEPAVSGDLIRYLYRMRTAREEGPAS